MKKLFTLLFIFTFSVFSFIAKAQIVVHYTSAHVSGDPSTILEADAKIINTAGSAVTVKVIRSNTSIASGHYSYFCLGVNCYTPSIYVSPPLVIAPGDSELLITYADPQGTNGTDQVNYRIYDVADSANNKVLVDFTYDFATGIKVLNNSAYNYMNCTQSNTESITNVAYNIVDFRDAKLMIRNLLGSVVKEITLADKQGTLRVSTSELPSGIYMYFLLNNDVPVATKKMVISHR
jgi:hypothetical protein